MHTRRIIAFCCLCLVFFATALRGQQSQDSKGGAQQVVEKYRAAASKNWEKASDYLQIVVELIITREQNKFINI